MEKIGPLRAGDGQDAGNDQEHGGDELAEQFAAWGEGVDIIEQAKEHDGHGAQEDSGGDLDGGGDVVMRAQEDGDGHAGDPTEENRDAAEIGDGADVDFAFVVWVIDNAMAMGEDLHEGGQGDGDEEGDIKDGDVGGDDGGVAGGDGYVCHRNALGGGILGRLERN